MKCGSCCWPVCFKGCSLSIWCLGLVAGDPVIIFQEFWAIFGLFSAICCPMGTCRLKQNLGFEHWTQENRNVEGTLQRNLSYWWLLRLFRANTAGILVCNKIVSVVSWPSELLPLWHFIINTFFPPWYWFPAILLLLRFYFCFIHLFQSIGNILFLASSRGRHEWCPYGKAESLSELFLGGRSL